ncbi:MAG: DUF4261 domain-containing protein, partial [Pyrinomonadaceae bacterium]
MTSKVFTQSAYLLLGRKLNFSEIERALSDYHVMERDEEFSNWMLAGPRLMIVIRHDDNEVKVEIDLVNQRWPDEVGCTEEDLKALCGGPDLNHFGRLFPSHSLERAISQAWDWPDARATVSGHQGFIRLRSVEASIGRSDGYSNSKVLSISDALAELAAITEIAARLIKLDGVLCYFNPSGISLKTSAALKLAVEHYKIDNTHLIDVWSHVEMYSLEDAEGWLAMITSGMHQAGLPDHEACFETTKYDRGEVYDFLRNASLYTIDKGQIVVDEDVTTGPGNTRWSAHC